MKAKCICLFVIAGVLILSVPSLAFVSTPLTTAGSQIPEKSYQNEQLDDLQKLLSIITKSYINESEAGMAGPMSVTAGLAVRGGDARYAAAGLRSVNGTAVSADDVMRVGSQTKTYTTTVILDLISKGKLSLDDTIESLDEKFNLGLVIPDKAAALKQKTVKDLLEMTTQIEDYLHVKEYADSETGVVYPSFIDYVNARLYIGKSTVKTPTELINLGFTASPEATKEGYDGTYSNTNCTILAATAESLTGKSLGTLLSEHIFDKLQIDTQFPQGGDLDSSKHEYARGYNYIDSSAAPSAPWNPIDVKARNGAAYFNSTSFDASISWAAGAIAANIPDQLKWINELVFNSHGVLSTDIYEQRVASLFESSKSISGLGNAGFFDGTYAPRPEASDAQSSIQAVIEVAPMSTDYGYGIYRAVSPCSGNYMRGHGGSITGYVSLCFWLEDLDIGLVFNSAGTGFDSNGIYTAVSYPYWESEIAISRYLNQNGGMSAGAISPAVNYGSTSDTRASWTRGIITLEPITAASGALEVAPSGRSVTYTDPSLIYLDEGYGIKTTINVTDPSVSYYGNSDEGDCAAIIGSGAAIHIQAGANAEARGTDTSALLLTAGQAVIDGEATAWGPFTRGVTVDGSTADAVIASGGRAYAQGWQSAGLLVKSGTASVFGTAEGGHQAFGIKVEGGTASIETGGTAKASTVAIGGSAVGAFVSSGELYAKNGSTIDAPYNNTYSGGSYNAALWLGGSGIFGSETGSSIGNSKIGWGLVLTSGDNTADIRGSVITNVTNVTNGYIIWGDSYADKVTFGEGSEATGVIDMGGAANLAASLLSASKKDKLIFDGAVLNLKVLSGDEPLSPIRGVGVVSFNGRTTINFLEPEKLVGKSFPLFDDTTEEVSGLSNIVFGNTFSTITEDGTVTVTSVKDSVGSSGCSAARGTWLIVLALAGLIRKSTQRRGRSA